MTYTYTDAPDTKSKLYSDAALAIRQIRDAGKAIAPALAMLEAAIAAATQFTADCPAAIVEADTLAFAEWAKFDSEVKAALGTPEMAAMIAWLTG